MLYAIKHTIVSKSEFDAFTDKCDIVFDNEHGVTSKFPSTNTNCSYTGDYTTYEVTCTECNNCIDCVDCYGCVDCIDCRQLTMCSNCINCELCFQCKECNNSSYCRYCNMCVSAVKCYFCNECNYITLCSNCYNSNNMIYCITCKNCSDGFWSYACTNKHSCYLSINNYTNNDIMEQIHPHNDISVNIHEYDIPLCIDIIDGVQHIEAIVKAKSIIEKSNKNAHQIFNMLGTQ